MCWLTLCLPRVYLMIALCLHYGHQRILTLYVHLLCTSRLPFCLLFLLLLLLLSNDQRIPPSQRRSPSAEVVGRETIGREA